MARISADTSTAVFTPSRVRTPTMPGWSTKRYGRRSWPATSASARPMKRLAETMVFSASSPCAAERVVADLAAAAFQVAHGRRQDHAALVVGQALGHAVAHRGHQRVRGAEVDAHGDAALVRIGRLAGFGDLEQCHGNSSSL